MAGACGRPPGFGKRGVLRSPHDEKQSPAAVHRRSVLHPERPGPSRRTSAAGLSHLLPHQLSFHRAELRESILSVQNLRFRYKGCPCPLSLNSFLRRSCSAMFTRSGRPVCLPRCACSTLAKPQSSKRGAPALEPFSCFPFRLGIILPLNRAELRNPSWSVREALTDCNQKERATREERRLSRGWL